MPDFTIVPGDANSVGGLLGMVPPGVTARLVLVDMQPDDVRPFLGNPSVRRVTVVRGAPTNGDPEAAGRRLEPLLRDGGPVLLDSSQVSRDRAGWLCARLDAPIVWAVDAVAIADDAVEVDHVVLGGRYRLKQRVSLIGPSLIVTKPAAVAADDAPAAQEPDIEWIEGDAIAPRVRLVSAAEETDKAPPLESARVVVGVGRGIGGPEVLPTFASLAQKLGASLGASRVAVDAGWLPFRHQIGQTGHVISADVYLAFGISGAVQHLAGIRNCKRIIAVNLDEHAPLCRMSDLVVRADAIEVAEALLGQLHGS